MPIGASDQVDAGEKKRQEREETYGPLPAGKYPVWLTEWKIDNGKSRDGKHDVEKVNLTFEVLDGEFKNRKIFQNVFIAHTGYPDMAVQGIGVISQFVMAAGSPPTDDLTPLQNKRVVADVVARKRKVTDRESGQIVEKVFNDISGFAMSSDAPPANPIAASNTPAAPSQPAAPAPPWAQ